MALYGQVATRTSLLYAFGIAGVLPISIVSLAVTTRYLPPSDFGVLAALLAVSSLITVLGGVGFLQGMMMAAYRLADDEEVDAVAEPRVDDLAADDASAAGIWARGSSSWRRRPPRSACLWRSSAVRSPRRCSTSRISPSRWP